MNNFRSIGENEVEIEKGTRNDCKKKPLASELTPHVNILKGPPSVYKENYISTLKLVGIVAGKYQIELVGRELILFPAPFEKMN